MSNMVKRLIIVVGVLAVIILGMRIWARIYPEWLWFSESVNFLSVYWITLKTKLGLGIGFGFVFLALTLGNLFLLWRFALRKMDRENVIPIGDGQFTLGRKLVVGIIVLLCLIASVIAVGVAVEKWEPYLRFVNSDGLSFSQIDPQYYKDPIFENDIAYYVFRMPFLRFVQWWFFLTFLFPLTLGTVVIYALFGGFSAERPRLSLSLPQRAHLFVLCSITLLLLAWGRIFAMYELLAPETTVRHGWVYGVGYTDHVARIPVYKILMWIAIVSAVLFFVSIFVRRMTWVSIGAVGLFVLVAFVGGLVYPWVIQRFQVEPQEFDREKEYIGYNINYTRKAYNLDKIVEEAYKGTGELTLEEITQNRAVMENIRLWDWRPLRKTFKERDTRRLQYDFVDIDIDRYMLDGQVRQVMLSARELIFSKMPNQAWVNRTFKFTHGHGLTMIPVSEIEEGGYPRMYIKDIPPKTQDPWKEKIEKPEIYYGEGERVSFRSELGKLPYVIVDPEAGIDKEFDYPRGEEEGQEEEDAYTTYSGDGGVPMSSFWRRLAYALKFPTDVRNILFSGKITDTSRILLHRSISERVRTIAPFLKYDKDPYLVVSQGNLYWIQDAYTTTVMYPYSEPMIKEITEVFGSGGQRRYRTRGRRVLNYIRNSVKVVIDVYDGTVTYYLMTGEKGQEDPIAECYRNIFPDLFTDFREMDGDLKRHIRYPLTMFMTQADKYRAYHMDKPAEFFGQEDLWQVGTEKYGETAEEQPVEPYYVVLQLPNSEKEEFMLMLPFTPAAGRKNMVAWLAAKCDPGEDGDLGEYGDLLVYNFPKGGELIDGTSQIEAYIDQEVKMSAQLSRWSEHGSTVIRGNMLAIPIKQSMLYVEPIYLQAEGEGAIPQLKRVVVAQGGKLEWGETLESALAALYGTPVAPAPEEVAQVDQPPPTGIETSPELAQRALDQYNRAQEHLRAGEWAKYGEELKKLKETLRLLQARSQ